MAKFDQQQLTKDAIKKSQELSGWKSTRQPVAQSSIHNCREAMQECQNAGPMHGELIALGIGHIL